ncbi:hypothetical protein [Parvularcula sp. LCG005]|uniref:hypothetical protein n=1 Tax=Parvularcula sp. LCG005 TaxID=3078805 RepID=UPI0029423837|nr:hypothetical protein [Parvularcula sp. LCG005]WOI54720.1 hypothetical protein RUI03_06875 [Parvularcula sp. LCG005]
MLIFDVDVAWHEVMEGSEDEPESRELKFSIHPSDKSPANICSVKQTVTSKYSTGKIETVRTPAYSAGIKSGNFQKIFSYCLKKFDDDIYRPLSIASVEVLGSADSALQMPMLSVWASLPNIDVHLPSSKYTICTEIDFKRFRLSILQRRLALPMQRIGQMISQGNRYPTIEARNTDGSTILETAKHGKRDNPDFGLTAREAINAAQTDFALLKDWAKLNFSEGTEEQVAFLEIYLSSVAPPLRPRAISALNRNIETASWIKRSEFS